MSGINQTFRGKVDLLNTGDPFYSKFIGQTVPGSNEELINYEVPAGKILLLLQVNVSCRMETKTLIYDESEEIGSGRTGPGNLNMVSDWKSYRIIDEGNHLIVMNESSSYRPASDIEAFAQGRLVPKP